MQLDRISPRGEGKNTFRVVIETSRGSRNKYSYEPEEKMFVLKKVLPEGHVFPFDFGFIPQTRGQDGDPLDVLVMMDEPVFPGCVVETRIIGVIEANQTEKGKTMRNDRFIAVADRSVLYRGVTDLRRVDRAVVEQIEHFFVSYNELARKRFQPLRALGATAAKKGLARMLPAAK